MRREHDEETRETEDQGQEDEGDDLGWRVDYTDDDYPDVLAPWYTKGRRRRTQVYCKRNSRRQDKSTNKLDPNNKLHTKAKSPAQITDQDKLHEIVYGAVDPPTTLRE